ncbi:MAG: chromosome segregation protein SMC [Gammaproteobacteria bacterium]|nr:chromosome segregation protein SMC [Gammaproteobacteria bacterium]
MRLTKIKLAGFKSFVDPTSLHLPSNLVAIVGPNGCGKSNIIDAVRWVMGEGSAKSLRGESMADVIFNGAAGRKPVGQATIELVFDNSDGGLGGPYAQYAEVSIRRQVGRDGQSDYFLNGTRCRRRDIVDLFLGTGLGPHSYAIIEQGMISRLIEARPDDLRVLLEEAAGVSKYKERRRETENRMGHTRENLARIGDVREELGKQLERLQRQANAAERYQRLKQEERRLKAELMALRQRSLQHEVSARVQETAEQETALEARLADQRRVEAVMEKQRAEQTGANDAFNVAQKDFYSISAEITRLEQALQHARERRVQLEQDQAQVERSLAEAQTHLDADRKRAVETEQELAALEPECAGAEQVQRASQEALIAAEQTMQAVQAEWETSAGRNAESAQQMQLARTRAEHAQTQLRQLDEQAQRVQADRAGLSYGTLEQDVQGLQQQLSRHEQQGQDLQQEAETLQARIAELRAQHQRLSGQLQAEREQAESMRSRLASLEALQQEALGQNEESVSDWLRARGLSDAQRLAQGIEVESGWERALEAVLGFHLGAVCVTGWAEIAASLESLTQGTLDVFDTTVRPQATASRHDLTLLSAKVRSELTLAALLADVYVADSLVQALAVAPRLQVHESVVTRDGVWLGNGWMHAVRSGEVAANSVLLRAQEIKTLTRDVRAINAQVTETQQQLEQARSGLEATEARRDTTQAALNLAHRQYGEMVAETGNQQARLDQLRAHEQRLQAEMEDIGSRTAQARVELQEAQERMLLAEQQHALHSAQQEALAGQRDARRAALEQARLQAHRDQEALHQLALRSESLRTALGAAQQSLERTQHQLDQLAARRTELESALHENAAPTQAYQDELEQALVSRTQAETALAVARRMLEEIEHALRTLEQERHSIDQQVQQGRTSLEQLRLQGQELRVRAQALEEQITAAGFETAVLLAELVGEAEEATWHEKLSQIEQKIQRLGAINLAAIDEFAELSERKTYLDAQNEDLSQALATLEDAIRKIDRETRTRFRETFEKVNTGLQAMFPRLFGGGHAYLELVGDEQLTTGVTVMARPPGKRNSTIHLLSGGEKALTALALVMAIFELNPAPFCILDEVDAPLDEANVGRFCQLISEMSQRIQFIYITHNKASMEMAHQLTGVTMQEPGVSRLVVVDVDEAVQLVAS